MTSAGLVLLYAPDFQKLEPAYLLRTADMIIGSSPTSDLHIEALAVSARHARLRHHDGRWLLSDVGSKNGTLVDGESIRGEVALEPLQEVRLGDAMFKFVHAGAESYVDHHIDGSIRGETRARWEERVRCPILGGYQMRRLVKTLERVAGGDISIILHGETGTGKEVFARWLHAMRQGLQRRKGELVAVNCAAIVPNLAESELFGVKRGAFSGADRDRPGLFQAAHGGTLFLDEVSELPLELQAKLLRALESREVIPVGGREAERVDVRIVCATNRDPKKLVEAGLFRADLFARLNGFQLDIPPLRKRKEDIFALCKSLLARYTARPFAATTPFMTAILHHDYPLNVRELEQLMHQLVSFGEVELRQEHLPEQLMDAMKDYGRTSPVPPVPEGAAGDPDPLAPSPLPSEAELRKQLARKGGNRAAVGRHFDRTAPTIARWMDHYGIGRHEYR